MRATSIICNIVAFLGVAHATFDKCDRPVAQWAGLNQVRRPYARPDSKAGTQTDRHIVHRPKAMGASTLQSTMMAVSTSGATSALLHRPLSFHRRPQSHKPFRLCPDRQRPPHPVRSSTDPSFCSDASSLTSPLGFVPTARAPCAQGWGVFLPQPAPHNRPDWHARRRPHCCQCAA